MKLARHSLHSFLLLSLKFLIDSLKNCGTFPCFSLFWQSLCKRVIFKITYQQTYIADVFLEDSFFLLVRLFSVLYDTSLKVMGPQ